MQPRGCHLGDVAPDRGLNHKVNAFINAEMLEMSPAASDFQKQMYKDGGLYEETPETMVAMKVVFAEYRRHEMSKKK